MTWSTFVRHYRAPMMLPDGQLGTWYGEYYGIFTVREFVVHSNRGFVAPFDIAFRESGPPRDPPPLAGIASISFPEFESLWERFAQARLHDLAAAPGDSASDGEIHYFRGPFPADFKIGEASSDLYYECAGGVTRRFFEVLVDHTEVLPFDGGGDAPSTDEMLRAAREGVDTRGEPIDPRLRPAEIHHADFEATWERHALPRLHMLAGLPPEIDGA